MSYNKKDLGNLKKYSFGAFIAFSEKSFNKIKGIEIWEEILQGESELVVNSNMMFEFYTMLPDMEAYRKIIKKLDKLEAIITKE